MSLQGCTTEAAAFLQARGEGPEEVKRKEKTIDAASALLQQRQNEERHTGQKGKVVEKNESQQPDKETTTASVV
jgi:hypothetical protein